jgi:hypothetical protein
MVVLERLGNDQYPLTIIILLSFKLNKKIKVFMEGLLIFNSAE